MSQYVNTGLKAFTASEAIGKFLRVKLDTNGKLAIAGLNDADLGTLEDAAFADGDCRVVRLSTMTGTRKVVAAKSISIGAPVFQDAGGKVTTTAGGKRCGVALQSASADGDVLEILDAPADLSGTSVLVGHHTANTTLNSNASGSLHTNLGASAAITFTLPTTVNAGVNYKFIAMTAQELRVAPGVGNAIYINGAKQADNKYVSFDDEGECLVLTADGNGDWISGPANGTFTVEA